LHLLAALQSYPLNFRPQSYATASTACAILWCHWRRANPCSPRISNTSCNRSHRLFIKSNSNNYNYKNICRPIWLAGSPTPLVLYIVFVYIQTHTYIHLLHTVGQVIVLINLKMKLILFWFGYLMR